MHTFHSRDHVWHSKQAQGKAEAARIVLCANHDYMTFTGECQCIIKADYVRYIVVGTDYGLLRNTEGDLRMWRSASGARGAAATYRKAQEEV